MFNNKIPKGDSFQIAFNFISIIPDTQSNDVRAEALASAKYFNLSGTDRVFISKS